MVQKYVFMVLIFASSLIAVDHTSKKTIPKISKAEYVGSHLVMSVPAWGALLSGIIFFFAGSSNRAKYNSEISSCMSVLALLAGTTAFYKMPSWTDRYIFGINHRSSTIEGITLALLRLEPLWGNILSSLLRYQSVYL